MEIKNVFFGQTKTGGSGFRLYPEKQCGDETTILTYGAAVQSLKFAGTDVVLGL